MTKEEKDLNKAVFKSYTVMYNLYRDKVPESFRLINDRAKKIVSTLESGGDIPDDEIVQLTAQINALNEMDFEVS